MLGFGALGSAPLGAITNWAEYFRVAPALSVSALITPGQNLLVSEKSIAEGILIKSTSVIWSEIARVLGSNWARANELSPEQWEEMVAGAFHQDGFDEVIL